MEGEEDDGQVAANAEMRYIALELMKLSVKSGRGFDELAREYLRMQRSCRGLFTANPTSPTRRGGAAQQAEMTVSRSGSMQEVKKQTLAITSYFLSCPTPPRRRSMIFCVAFLFGCSSRWPGA